MSDAADGTRAGTKITKVTTTTRNKSLFVIFVGFVIFVSAREPWAVGQQGQPRTQAQQRPVFRAGTHFVRVDAYPVQDGKIVEGLKPEDFEILEDGKPQAIDSFDFVRFDTFTPEAERQEPQTQEEGFALAADPRNRVFVIVVDIPRSGKTDVHYIQQPLINFLDRVMGPTDLFGLLTTRNTAKDLVLARKTIVAEAQMADLFRSANIDRDEADDLDACANGAGALKQVFRDDQTYTALETLVVQLGAIREERKSVVFVANSITRARSNVQSLGLNGGRPPAIGITNGKIGIGDQPNGYGVANDSWCSGEVQRLSAIDFDQRYFALIDEARHQNVAFYIITPEGLPADHRPDDNIIALANNTDGVAIVNTNDLNGGMTRIAADLRAYYVLGYYTTNTKFDGGIRKITVKLKGKAIRARREYRAPTEAEIGALASKRSPVSRASATAGPPTLIGDPVAFRVAGRQPPQRVSLLEFERSDRLRVEWPVLAPLDRREARLLDSSGKPLPIDLPLSENENHKTVTVELPLASFARGVYSIELTAGAGPATEYRRLTFIMK